MRVCDILMKRFFLPERIFALFAWNCIHDSMNHMMYLWHSIHHHTLSLSETWRLTLALVLTLASYFPIIKTENILWTAFRLVSYACCSDCNIFIFTMHQKYCSATKKKLNSYTHTLHYTHRWKDMQEFQLEGFEPIFSGVNFVTSRHCYIWSGFIIHQDYLDLNFIRMFVVIMILMAMLILMISIHYRGRAHIT